MLEDLPAVLTVEEAAKVLRIGRATAYEGVRMYLASGGAEGIPAIKVGPRTIRVPRAALLMRLSEVGPPHQRAGREQPGVPVLSERFDPRVGAEEDVR